MDENLTDALKMAAAVLVFVGALTTAIISFSRARATTDRVMTNLEGVATFYDNDNIYLNNTEINVSKQRIVGKDEVIANLYNYYSSGYTILFYYLENSTDFDADTRTIKNGATIKPLVLYYTEAIERSLNKSILRVNSCNFEFNSTTGKPSNPSVSEVNDYKSPYRAIYGLDINDEINRQEPWTATQAYDKKFVEDLINGYGNTNKNSAYTISGDFKSNRTTPNNYYTFGTPKYYRMHFWYCDSASGKMPKSLMDSKARFVERNGEYRYTTKTNFDLSAIDPETLTISENAINVIESYDASKDYLTNGETVENNEGFDKKVIQYIYVGEF